MTNGLCLRIPHDQPSCSKQTCAIQWPASFLGAPFSYQSPFPCVAPHHKAINQDSCGDHKYIKADNEKFVAKLVADGWLGRVGPELSVENKSGLGLGT
jgi:hypothetical protein